MPQRLKNKVAIVTGASKESAPRSRNISLPKAHPS